MQPVDPPALTISGSGWRESKWLAICELCLVGLIFVAARFHLIYFSKTPYLLIVAWVSLRLRNVRWREVGLSVHRNWPMTLALGIGLGFLTEAFQLLVTQPVLAAWIGKQPDLSVFNALKGNIPLMLLGIAFSWTLAAVGESIGARLIGYRPSRSFW